MTEMNKNTGLTYKQWTSIRQVFENYPMVESAILFGSRAKGDFKNASDIDIAVKGTQVDLNCILDLHNDFDDLMLPYKFDLVNFNHIDEPDLIDHINRIGFEIYSKENQTASYEGD